MYRGPHWALCQNTTDRVNPIPRLRSPKLLNPATKMIFVEYVFHATYITIMKLAQISIFYTPQPGLFHAKSRFYTAEVMQISA